MRAAIAARLVEEYGSPRGAADASWALARENQWYREGEAAERYLMQQPVAATMKNEAALELIVAWHGTPIGHLTHDGFEWRWKPTDFAGPPLIRQTTPGKLPPFIVSLLPEGWLERCSTTRTSVPRCGPASATCQTSPLRRAKRNWLRFRRTFS